MDSKVGGRAMELRFKRAGAEDLDVLVRTRVEVLRAVNGLDEDTDMSVVAEESYEYYKSSLVNGAHTAYLVFDGEKFIGSGGISFFRVMPTYHNPTGRKAYIMNIYTDPEYRRRGVGYKVVDLLVSEAKKKGVYHITLEATKMGRKLYEKYGFSDMKDEMILK